jgi:hypothetical protein
MAAFLSIGGYWSHPHVPLLAIDCQHFWHMRAGLLIGSVGHFSCCQPSMSLTIS